MATQSYPPQMGAPAFRPGKFVPGFTAETVVLSSVPGEKAPSEFGPPETCYRLTDGRKWYVPQMIADAMSGLGIQAGQPIAVRKTGRAKEDLHILPLNGAGRTYDAPVPNSTNTHTSSPNGNAAPPAAPPATLTPAAACMMASMCAAVDAILETQAYATRKGLGLTFSEESVRAIGLSIYIDACRNGGAR